MAATQFVPLELSLINEGVFVEDINDELKDLQTKLALFHRTYGEAAEKATAKLTVEIMLRVENAEAEGAFSIKTGIKSVLPKRPATVSIAIGGVNDDHKLALFVRSSGSDETHPKQLKLATQDGRIIDQETGRVLDDPAK
jgi:hypothetical protein